MKKLIVVAVIAMMITGLSVAANAYAGTVLNLQPDFVDGSMQTIQMGWYTDNGVGGQSADAYDGTDLGTDASSPAGQMRFDLGNISGQPTSGWGKTNGDFRAPNAIGDLTHNIGKRWIVTASIDNNPDHVGGTYGLNAWFNPGLGPTGAEFYIFSGTVSSANAKLWANAGTNYFAKLDAANNTYDGPISWVMPAPTSYSSYDEGLEMDVVVWQTTPVTQTFTIYAQGASAVPEPGSMLAMFSGLVGLVGFGIRRRK